MWLHYEAITQVTFKSYQGVRRRGHVYRNPSILRPHMGLRCGLILYVVLK